MEHRHARRSRALALAETQDCNGQRDARLIYNISREGMFLLGEKTPELNSCIEIYLSQLREEEAPVRFPGLVVHSGRGGFGVMFTQLDHSARTLVEKLLRHNPALEQGGEGMSAIRGANYEAV